MRQSFAYDRRSLLAGGAGLALNLGARPGRAAAVQTRLTDLMPDFWRAWDATRDLSEDAVPARLMADFFTPYADVYEGAGVKKVTLERIGTWIAWVAPHIPAMRRLSARFRADYDQHLKHFMKAFPDFDPAGTPIYLMPSFGNFDGHTQKWNGVIPLFLGVDGLVVYHGDDADLAVILDHETFHIYQDQVNPGLNYEGSDDQQNPIYIALWQEGMAQYVSEVLNPNASRLSVLGDDRELAAAGADEARRGAGALAEHLESREDKVYWRYFSKQDKDITGRLGYLVGLMIVKSSAPGRTLRELARLDRAQVRSMVETRLKAIRYGDTNGF